VHDVFLSYSHHDRRFIEKLAADLREHHVNVWLDTMELEVGDLVHESIEQGIEQSRYFCIALSPAALQSYYVRKVEFDTAFTRLVREQRDSFILPIVIQKINAPLPARLEGRSHLDFTKRTLYTTNMRKLAKKINLEDRQLTGKRWYKNLDISTYGEPVGVAELSQKAVTGFCVSISWRDGVATQVDVYLNGERVNYKQFGFDEQGRVIKNMMYSPDGQGGWHLVEDVWYYTYDPVTGRRATKTMKYEDARAGRKLTYNQDGKVIEENIVTDDGLPDHTFRYARKVFEYSPEGHVAREIHYDWDGKVLV
jgi:hypothetical protein